MIASTIYCCKTVNIFLLVVVKSFEIYNLLLKLKIHLQILLQEGCFFPNFCSTINF